MREERIAIADRALPELKAFCRKSLVSFSFVDLRWGITRDEQVIDVCLSEIDRCRPYFIALLGDRYGWVPEKEQLEGIPEMRRFLEGQTNEKSVTELEIRYGALEEPEMNDSAFIYLRKPDTESGATAEEEWKRERLTRLKDEIELSGLKYRTYSNLDELVDHVVRDLKSTVSHRFPPSTIKDDVDRERLGHIAFGEDRCKVYIDVHKGRYFQELTEAVGPDGSPMIVVGEPGSGKTALLANWAKGYARDNPDDMVFVHFIGSTQESSDQFNLMTRFISEVQKRYDIEEHIGQSYEETRSAFRRYIEKAGNKARLVMVIDALNQLRPMGKHPDISWLPKVYPEGVHVVASIANENLAEPRLQEWAKNVVLDLGWELKPLIPLTKQEDKEIFINGYLGDIMRKKIDEPHMERISKARQTANPLFLKTLLEELKKVAFYGERGKDLTKDIDQYLKARNTVELYQLILGRLERAFESHGNGLVGEILSSILVSKEGLTREEIIESRVLPPYLWSKLFFSLEGAFISRMGLLDFFHEHLKIAVNNRYLTESESRRKAHRELASYFQEVAMGVPASSVNVTPESEWHGDEPRGFTELPFHLLNAEMLEELHEVLTDFVYLEQRLKLTPQSSTFGVRDGFSMTLEDYSDAIKALEES